MGATSALPWDGPRIRGNSWNPRSAGWVVDRYWSEDTRTREGVAEHGAPPPRALAGSVALAHERRAREGLQLQYSRTAAPRALETRTRANAPWTWSGRACSASPSASMNSNFTGPAVLQRAAELAVAIFLRPYSVPKFFKIFCHVKFLNT